MIEFAAALAVSVAAYFVCKIMIAGIADDSDFAFGLALAGFAGIPIIFLIAFAPYIGAVIVLLVGLAKRRVGLILGPLAFGVGLWILYAEQVSDHESALTEAANHAWTLDQRRFLPIEGSHDIIAVDGEGFCRSICKQILMQTSYAFATKRFAMAEPWDIYRRVAGEACLAPENRASYLDFLEAGYVGFCATRETWTPAKDGVFVSKNDNSPRAAQELLGPFVTGGRIYEAYERRDGRSRLLGRWISARMFEPRNEFISTSMRDHRDVGKPFEPEDFFAVLLKIPIVKGDRPGPATTAQLLDALLALVDDTETGRKALELAGQVVRRSAEADPAPALRWIRTLLSDPDRKRVLAGFDLLAKFPESPDLDFAKPILLSAMASGDAQLAAKALKSIHVVPEGDALAFESAITSLAFDPVLRPVDSPVAEPLFDRLRFRDTPFPAELRRRAMERIKSSDRLSRGEMTVLLLIFGRKHGGPHMDLFRFIESLQGENFETAVKVVGDLGWRALEGGDINRWSEMELEVLVLRAAHVPNERFKAYVDAFRFQTHMDSLKSALADEVDKRLDALRNDPTANHDWIKRFERLRQIIRTNTVS